MRKSGKIVLSVFFLAAINVTETKAQERYQGNRDNDTSSHKHNVTYAGYHRGNWLTNIFHRNNSRSAPRPTTGGFGTTVRPQLRVAS